MCLKDGRVIERARSHAKGSAAFPAGWDDIAEKFAECTHGILDAIQRDTATAMIKELDTLPRVRELTEVLRVL